MRVGLGYDVHRYEKGRKLILGGEIIDYELGLAGHSDADVLTHAIMDALLGAAGLGDIGEHFPDNDSTYKDIDSLLLLKKVADLLDESGFYIENIDAIIVCQSPKLKKYKKKMQENLSTALKIEVNRINIKATTEEGLGFTGNLEGVSAKAICLIDELDVVDSCFVKNTRKGCCCRH